MDVLCGKCGQTAAVDPAMQGQTISCPHCSRELPVPRLDETAPAEPAPPQEDEGFASHARAAMEKKIRVVCGKCGRGLIIQASRAGKKATCPGCGKRIRIPYPDDDEEFERPATETAEDDGDVQVEGIELIEPGEELNPPPDAQLRGGEAALPVAEGIEEPAEEEQRGLRIPWWPIGITVFVLAWMAALGYWLQQREQPAVETPSTQPSIIAARPAVTPPVITPAPATQETPAAVPSPSPTPTATPAPAAVPPGARVTGASWQPFATGGYFPAAPGRVYLRLTMEITGGSQPLELQAQGADIFVVSGGARCNSAGVPADDTFLPRRGLPKAVRVAPGKKQFLTLLFETPESISKPVLAIRDVGERDLKLPPPPAAPPTEALAGTYVEQPPRNLKPLLSDPVMSAIQNAYGQKLVITRKGDEFGVSIPAAGVSGTAKPLAAGGYRAKLTAGEHSLQGRIRLLSDGKTLVLYLSDEPFHQLTYVKQPAD